MISKPLELNVLGKIGLIQLTLRGYLKEKESTVKYL